MQTAEVDIKPLAQTDDFPDNSLLVSPGSGTGKLKQSRYEDVWPEDVHAAFMEAVALYPPMGKRRLKYYRVSTHENEHPSDTNRAKSFGRCQLIQSYIMEKTGRNRSRKQVSSHLQRLKKIHKDNPAMQPFFSECSQPPEHYPTPQAIAISSQDIFANISFSTRHLKSDFDLTVNLQNTGMGTDSPPMFPYSPEASIFDGSCNMSDLSADLHNQSSIFTSQEFPSAQQFPTDTSHPSASDYLSELPDPPSIRDGANGGFRAGTAFNTSAFSISMRRLAPRLPAQGRVDSCPATHFPRAIHVPAFQPTHQWIPHDGLVDGISHHSLPAPAQQLLHTPFHPLQSFLPEKLRLGPDLASDWIWPQNPDGLRGGTFDKIHSRCSPTLDQSNLTYPEIPVDSPGFHSSPSESEASRLPPEFPSLYVATGYATRLESVSTENTADFPEQVSRVSFEDLGSAPVIRPTPVYPVSYVHSDDARASPSTLLP